MIMAQSLLFVPDWQPEGVKEAHTQRRIRRHVMKNITRAKRKAASEKALLVALQPAQLPILPFATPPVPWRFYMPAFLNNWMTCFVPTMCSKSEDSIISHQGIWLRMAMNSASLFHATLALSAAYHHRLSHEKLQQLALYHVGEAISEINATLCNANLSLTDDIILAVGAIAAYENLKGNSTSCRTHLVGLQSMVGMRGGYSELGILVQHAIHWLDCSFATATASKPMFPIQKPQLEFPNVSSGWFLMQTGNLISPTLQSVLSQLRQLTGVLDASYLSPVDMSEMWKFSTARTYLEQELLLMSDSSVLFSNNSSSLSNGIGEIVRLGATIYLNLVLRGIPPLSGVHKSLSTRLASCIKSIGIDALTKDEDDLREVLMLLLWSAIIGGTIATEASTRRPIALLASKLIAKLRVSYWTECRGIMQQAVYCQRGCGDLCEKFYIHVMVTNYHGTGPQAPLLLL